MKDRWKQQTLHEGVCCFFFKKPLDFYSNKKESGTNASEVIYNKNEFTFIRSGNMYLSILETAEYLQLPVNEIHRLIREKQVRVVRIDNETLLNKEQFDLFLKAREKKKAEIEEYLNTPLPEDPDIKDED